ncbi:MAG: hypothetical protein KAT53_04975, partial [Dehalococcoidia bacterium]|nr:hypothetical protein [Dehalococcoidia bacterium]
RASCLRSYANSVGVGEDTSRGYSGPTGEDMIMRFPGIHGATVIVVDPDTTISTPTTILDSVMGVNVDIFVRAGYIEIVPVAVVLDAVFLPFVEDYGLPSGDHQWGIVR